jgi:DNA-binding XRE family transcriptional regulator
MYNDMIKIGDTIRTARNLNNMTQNELSKAAGVSVRTIIDIEKGKRFPSMEVFIKIIRILNVPTDQIF